MHQQAIRTNQIAREIHQQLKSTFNINVLWSWGIAEQRAMTYRNMPSLGFRVNGYKHKGWVINGRVRGNGTETDTRQNE